MIDSKHPADEKLHRRKVDWRLLPILGSLYSVALIDRTNMSNAAVAVSFRPFGPYKSSLASIPHEQPWNTN